MLRQIAHPFNWEYLNILRKLASLTTLLDVKGEEAGKQPLSPHIKYLPAHKAFHKELHQGTTNLLCCHRAAF